MPLPIIFDAGGAKLARSLKSSHLVVDCREVNGKMQPPASQQTSGGSPEAGVVWPRQPSSEWPAEGVVPAAATRRLFQTELLRIPMEDAPRYTGPQGAVLRDVRDSILRACVQLCQERDAAATTESDENQRISHLTEFRKAFPRGLLSDLQVRGTRAGLDLSQIASALEDFCDSYESGPWSDGSTPLNPVMLNKICSIIQSCLYPIMPVEADTLLEHIEQGFKTRSIRDTDGALELGMRLAWGYLVTQPRILERRSSGAVGSKFLDPQAVHMLATIPLSPGSAQPRSKGHLKHFQGILDSVRAGSKGRPLMHDALLTFSEVLTKTCLTQPFCEGNHRTGWILANDWLLKAHGCYIPWNDRLGASFKDVCNYSGLSEQWVPQIVRDWHFRGFQKGIPRRFAEMLRREFCSVQNLPGMVTSGPRQP
jgi:hypothetical protein